MYYSKYNLGYVLRLEIGEEVQEALRRFAGETGIKAAFYEGIGTIHQVELAFFCKEEKIYNRKVFEDDYELIFLMGNLSLHNGAVTPHTHVAIGSRDFQTYSGHLVRGTISVTAELQVTPVDIPLSRKKDPILKYDALFSSKRTRLLCG